MSKEDKGLPEVLGSYMKSVIKAKGNGGSGEKQVFRMTKRAILEVAPSIFFKVLTKGERHTNVVTGLPEDTILVGIFYNHLNHKLNIVVESEEFDPILEGEKLPVLPPITATEYDCPFMGEDGESVSDLHLRIRRLDDIFLEMETAKGLPNYSGAKAKIKALLWGPMNNGE